jgi:hypothetical protein
MDVFRNGSQSDDVIMTNENSPNEVDVTPQSEETYPGKIVSVKSMSINQVQTQPATSEVGEVLDDGEIVEVQAPTNNNQANVNGVNSQFIEINKNKGVSVFVNVTNLSNQKIRVINLIQNPQFIEFLYLKNCKIRSVVILIL